MRAIVQDEYGSADVLALEEIAEPTIGDDEVLVRVRAAGVDPGVWHLMTGQPYLIRVMGFGLRRPKVRVRGTDVAGCVEEVGKEVTRFRPGDDVFGSCEGAFAEVTSAREEHLAAKPKSLSFEEAAAVPGSSLTALQGLRDVGEVRTGQSVLVIGAAGGIGTFAVQIAKSLGAEVTGVCSTAKTDLVRSLGADHAIDYTREDFADGRKLYDVILDTAGNRPLSTLRRALSPKGTLVIIGAEGGGRLLGGMGRVLKAIALSPFVGQRLRFFVAQESRDDLQYVKELIEAGRVAPVVDATYSLPDVPDAIRRWERGHARGKSVITIGSEA